jgi:ABC-type phosphate/phosphonate transport system permease subunit
VASIISLMVAAVAAIDRISGRLRRRLVGGPSAA